MKCCLSNYGDAVRSVDDDYVPVAGEAVFSSWPNDEEMLIAFPGRPAYLERLRVEALSLDMRTKRNGLMSSVYDAGTQMIRRELETLPLDTAYEAQLITKRAELHAYARLLQAVPEQTGFPDVITWPEQPTAGYDHQGESLESHLAT